ncbi:hypothetical protein ACJMK2_017490 [Sinanodonta woodiana]|uniref:Uncharacterized protein n=1 Tax=Sinanodonta woodiana TaxID=1069815 RepID=A0ABD3UC15_SINWO
MADLAPVLATVEDDSDENNETFENDDTDVFVIQQHTPRMFGCADCCILLVIKQAFGLLRFTRLHNTETILVETAVNGFLHVDENLADNQRTILVLYIQEKDAKSVLIRYILARNHELVIYFLWTGK